MRRFARFFGWSTSRGYRSYVSKPGIRGVIVIETKGLPPGFDPPSASLTGGGRS